jgi:integrase
VDVDEKVRALAATLSAHIARFSSTWIMCDESAQQMGPWQMQREVRKGQSQGEGLPDGFRFHDLRHFYASLLISSRLDVKVVQSRLRHASAKTTLDTYHTFGRIPMTALGPQSTMRSRRGAILRTLRTSEEG